MATPMNPMAQAMASSVLKSDVEAMWVATTSAPENADMAAAVAAMNVLADWIKKSKATTMMELQIQLKTAAEHIESFAPDVIALSGGCELFIRNVTRSNTEIPDFEECKAALVARSAYYKEMTLKSRNRIAELGETFIRDGSVVLLHGNSRVVQRVLQAAGDRGKRFSVMVTEGQPDGAPSRLFTLFQTPAQVPRLVSPQLAPAVTYPELIPACPQATGWQPPRL